jgi:hypothetical protein
VTRFDRNLKVGHHEIEQLTHIDLRIEDKRRLDALTVQPVEQPVEQRRLAGAHFARQQNEPFTVLYSVREAGQRFLNLLCQEQIARIRIDVERAFS